MVEREGFEPSKAYAARFTVWSLWPLGYLSEPKTSESYVTANLVNEWSWRRDSNPRPAVYKTAALPTELLQPATSFCEGELGPPPLVRGRTLYANACEG